MWKVTLLSCWQRSATGSQPRPNESNHTLFLLIFYLSEWCLPLRFYDQVFICILQFSLYNFHDSFFCWDSLRYIFYSDSHHCFPNSTLLNDSRNPRKMWWNLYEVMLERETPWIYPVWCWPIYKKLDRDAEITAIRRLIFVPLSIRIRCVMVHQDR